VSNLRYLGGRPGTAQALATSTTAASSATAFNANSHVVRLVATAGTFVSFNGPATLTTGMYLPPNFPEYFYMNGATNVSAILPTGTGALYITEIAQ
jgi:hypothetical protein